MGDHLDLVGAPVLPHYLFAMGAGDNEQIRCAIAAHVPFPKRRVGQMRVVETPPQRLVFFSANLYVVGSGGVGNLGPHEFELVHGIGESAGVKMGQLDIGRQAAARRLVPLPGVLAGLAVQHGAVHPDQRLSQLGQGRPFVMGYNSATAGQPNLIGSQVKVSHPRVLSEIRMTGMVTTAPDDIQCGNGRSMPLDMLINGLW